MKVLVVREHRADERRVAATPETVRKFVSAGFTVFVEAGAGERAGFVDEAYVKVGAEIVREAPRARANADILLAVALEDASDLKEGATLISFLTPHKNLELVRALVARKVSAFAMELVPRTTRAQSMDALSSQANLAGYKAVLLAASNLDKYFPLLMTAAGTVKPARVVIMGAGVAGLSAIATAKRLGAVVEVSDIRPETKEQVESLGGKFIELPKSGESADGGGGYAKEMSAEFLARQREIVAARIAQADVVITTAQIPGRPAPRLITTDVVERMRPGAVIVDLAAESGGNCELTVLGEIKEHRGVRIMGTANIPSTVPGDASVLYARNIYSLMELLAPKAKLTINLDDEIIRGTLLTYEGKVMHAPTEALLEEGAS